MPGGEVVLYIATSLDGRIADADGGVGWLGRWEGGDEDYGYRALLERTGALIMGSTTYEQVLTFGEWPYARTPVWVLTRRSGLEVPEGADVRFASGDVEEALAQVRSELERRDDVWLVGGADVARQFFDRELVDELIVTVAPVVLGAGPGLFDGAEQADLELHDAEPYPSGLVQLRYGPAAG